MSPAGATACTSCGQPLDPDHWACCEVCDGAALCLPCAREHLCTPRCADRGCLPGLCVHEVRDGVVRDEFGVDS